MKFKAFTYCLTALLFCLCATSCHRGPKITVRHATVVINDTLHIPSADSLFIVARDSVVLSERSAAFIVADKRKMRLSVCNFKSDTLLSVPMCCGKEYGDKQRIEDNRTPEGMFRVRRIEDSYLWEHKTASGRVEYGSYGPIFIRLECPPRHAIGIHGTRETSSIGKRSSEGCIRVTNDNIKKIARYAYVGMPVFILPSDRDIAANASYNAARAKK